MLSLITEHLDVWTTAEQPAKTGGRGRAANGNKSPYGIQKLRELILELAVRGKLVPQDPSDVSASATLKRMPEERQAMIDAGRFRKPKSLSPITSKEKDTIDIPKGWAAIRAGEIFYPRSGNSSLIKGRLEGEKREGLFPGFSASGQDVWLDSYEHEGEAVILSAVGARCGKAFLATGRWSAIANTHIIWFSLQAVVPRYAHLLLNNEKFWERSGGAQPFVKVQNTLQKIILLPPVAEQHRIVAKVDELMTLCDRLEQEQAESGEAHQTLVETMLGTLTRAKNNQELAEAWQRIAGHFDILFTTEQSIDQLKQTILQLAVMGKLVPQDPADEPATELLKKIAAEKNRLIKEGKIKKQKPLPAIGEDEQPKCIPEGWTVARLGEILNVINGRAYKKREMLDEGTPLLRVGNLFTSNEWYYSNLELEPDKYIDDGDLIYAWSASFGPFIWQGGKVIYHYHIWKLDLYADSCMDKKYLYNYLAAETERIKASGHGIAMVHMTKEKMENLVLAVPPLAEQHRIVAKVDELMALCDALKARLNETQATRVHLADAIVEQVVSRA